MESLGGGLSALAFWLFIAAVVVGGIWESIRKRDARHETLRRLIESGKPIDSKTMDKLLGDNKNLARDLKIGALVTLFVAPGLALLGLFLNELSPAALQALLGVALLVGCIALGLFVAAKMVERQDKDG